MYRTNIVDTGFGTICGLWHPLGSWNVSPHGKWGTTVLWFLITWKHKSQKVNQKVSQRLLLLPKAMKFKIITL